MSNEIVIKNAAECGFFAGVKTPEDMALRIENLVGKNPRIQITAFTWYNFIVLPDVIVKFSTVSAKGPFINIGLWSCYV